MARLRWANRKTTVCQHAETHSHKVSIRALVIGSHDRIIQLLQICWPHIHDAISCSTKELGNKSHYHPIGTGDSGGRLSIENPLSSLINQFERIGALQPPWEYSCRLWGLKDSYSVRKGKSVPRKYCPHDYTTTTSCLNPWYKKGWTYTSVLFTTNSGPTIWMSQQKLRLTRSVTVFRIFYCPVMVNLCEL